MSTSLPDDGRVQFGDLAPNERFRIRPGGNLFQRVGGSDTYRQVGQATTFRVSSLDLRVLRVTSPEPVES